MKSRAEFKPAPALDFNLGVEIYSYRIRPLLTDSGLILMEETVLQKKACHGAAASVSYAN